MPKRIICPKCEYVGPPTKKKRDGSQFVPSPWIVIPLNIALLGFGGKTIVKLTYEIDRIFRKIPACTMCGNTMLIDEESAVGRRLIQKKYGTESSSAAEDFVPPAPAIADKIIEPEIIQKPEPLPRMDPSRPEKDPEQF